MDSTLTRDAIELVKNFEGFQSEPYRDVAGVWTIGYGSTRVDGLPVDEHTTAVSEQQAEELMLDELEKTAARVKRLTTVPLLACELGALTSFAYNLGTGAYKSSTLRRRVNEHDLEAIPTEFLKWTIAGGRRQPGLVRRRQAEVALFFS